MMKMRPGTRMRPEKRKNQFRLPMMSNTSAGLPPGEATANGSGLEFLVTHPEKPGLLDDLLFHHEPQQGSRHCDGGEHGGRDTDYKDEGEALDRGGAAEVKDRRRDQRRHVGVQDRVPSSVEARLYRGRKRLAGPQLFLGSLEDQDVGVDRHTYREHEARDAGQGQRNRDDPEEGVYGEAVVDQRHDGN